MAFPTGQYSVLVHWTCAGVAVVGLRVWEHVGVVVLVEAAVVTADVTVATSVSSMQEHRSSVCPVHLTTNAASRQKT